MNSGVLCGTGIDALYFTGVLDVFIVEKLGFADFDAICMAVGLVFSPWFLVLGSWYRFIIFIIL